MCICGYVGGISSTGLARGCRTLKKQHATKRFPDGGNPCGDWGDLGGRTHCGWGEAPWVLSKCDVCVRGAGALLEADLIGWGLDEAIQDPPETGPMLALPGVVPLTLRPSGMGIACSAGTSHLWAAEPLLTLGVHHRT